MSNITLSFVLTTFNKLDYLKIVLGKLMDARGHDEEIIVVDGGSRDGTVEFLQELFNAGKIQKFVSEKDFGEAHGYNKGILLADGKLIKLVTDDDLFFFPVIRKSKGLMLNDPSIDITFSSGLDYDGLNGTGNINNFYAEDKANYENWFNKGTPFYACALGIIFKKESIPLIGLLSTNNIRVDMEFLLRITFNKKVKLRFCDGYSYLRFCNELSNSNKHDQRMTSEGFYLSNYYYSMAKEDYNRGLFKYLLQLNWRWFLLFISKIKPGIRTKKTSKARVYKGDLSMTFVKATEILEKENKIFEEGPLNQRNIEKQPK